MNLVRGDGWKDDDVALVYFMASLTVPFPSPGQHESIYI